MVVQVGAKLGYIPWAINDLPFADLPSMIIGLDVSTGDNSKGSQVFGLTATTDPNFSQYFSVSEYVKGNLEQIVYSSIQKALEHF